MIKTIFTLSSVLLLFISSTFFYEDEKVSIQPSIPAAVRPGEEFIVELNVVKGNLEGFASLQQYLPEGFTASTLESNHTTFLFKDHRVKFTWKQLPHEKSFRISYRIKTDVSCSGLKTMNGEFSYIENDKPKKVLLPPSVIILNNDVPSENSMSEDSNKDISVEKKIIPLTAKAGEYKVELKIKKGSGQNAVRIFDQVIEDYTAYPIETRGAKFSVANGLVEFYWATMPKDSVILVSYHIVSDKIHADYSISNLLQSDNTGAEKNINSPSESKPAARKSVESKPQPGQTSYLDIPAPQKGLFYKVQIAATMHKPERKSDFFRSLYKINESVDITIQDGWKKYLVGSFEKYAAAKQYRVATQAKIPDAFVVAYNNGERIPLNEALKTKNRN